jgi:uncharacterized protein (TIGR02246 family)
MKHIWKTFVPVFIAGSLAVPMMPTAVLADDAADVAAIEQLWVSYQTLAASGDGETWLGLWDPDGIQMPPGKPMRDVTALAEVVPNWTPDDMDAMQIDPLEIVILGDTAYSMGTYWFEFPTQEGAQGRFEGKFMTILKRQDDGSWKIFRDIFNANAE